MKIHKLTFDVLNHVSFFMLHLMLLNTYVLHYFSVHVITTIVFCICAYACAYYNIIIDLK